MIKTRTKDLAFILFILVKSFQCLGQAEQIVPPTPNAIKMTEYFSQRPNMYTGTANVSIPLYSIDFDGWQLPLSLSYNAGGIRTNEEASEVGLGWALNATGVISRTIRGGDDLWPGSSSSSSLGYVYHKKAVTWNLGYDDLHWNGSNPDTASYYGYLTLGVYKDTEPDVFNYNFFGFSGSFVLSQKVADPINHKIKPIKITQDACSILFDEPTKTFSVITPDGYRGDFTVKEKSTTFSSSTGNSSRIVCCSAGVIDIDGMIKSSARYRTPTSWYLSAITSPRGKVIRFIYDMATATNPIGNSYVAGETYSPYLSNTRSFGEQDYGQMPVCIQTVQEHIYLKFIVYPGSNYDTIKFTMETREDLRKNYLFTSDSSQRREFPSSLNLERYTGIKIRGLAPNSTLNKQITFVQNYFNQQYQNPYPNDQNEYELRWLRSRLDRVLIDDNEYQFYYDNGVSGTPNKLTTGIDHFGFYNGNDTNPQILPPQFYPPNKTYLASSLSLKDTSALQLYQQQPAMAVNFNYGKAGLLIKVKYPTRGFTVFTYEPHTYLMDTVGVKFHEYFSSSTGNLAGGARVSSINEYDSATKLVSSKSYYYRLNPSDNFSTTTGKLMTPLFNRFYVFNWSFPPPGVLQGFTFKFKTLSAIPGNNSTASGRLIGYSQVHEVVTGKTDNYRNTYYFENTPNKATPIASATVLITDNPNLNGETTEVRNYDSQGHLLQWVQNNDRYHSIDKVKAIMYEWRWPNPFMGWRMFYNIDRTFNTPYTIITTTASQANGLVEANDANKTVTINSAIQTQKKLSYNKSYLLKYERTKDSAGDSIVTRYNHPADYDTTLSSASPAIKYMQRATVNIVSPVIETYTKKRDSIVAAAANKYLLVSKFVNLDSTYSFNRNKKGTFSPSTSGKTFSSRYELVTRFTKYDPVTGKPLEYTSRDGVTHAFVWGYNGLLPVAHSVGANYTQLNTAYNTALGAGSLGTPAFENTLRANANLLNAQVSTYLHNPGIGIVSSTDQAGQKLSYQYDGFGRLVTTIDNAGKVTNQYKYHLKTRVPSRILTISATSINFGTLTPEMWATQLTPYSRCSDALRTQVLTLTNNGEDNLNVSSVQLPMGFVSNWYGGIIAPGTSVAMMISFDKTSPLGTYSGTVTINSNATGTTSGNTTSVTAVYASKQNSISFPATLNFGTITGNFLTQSITITNTGNYPVRVSGLSFDGDTSPHANATNNTFSVSASSQCIGGSLPSQPTSVTLQVTFTPPVNGTMTSKLSLYLDDGTIYNQAITLTGSKGTATKSVNAPSTYTFTSFTSNPATQSIPVSNVSSSTISVSSITSSNPLFTVSPSAFSISSGVTQNVNVSFAPTDFSTQTTNLIINSNDPAGASQVVVTAQRSQLYQLSGAPATVSIKPSQQTQSAYLTNTGNVPVTINAVPPSPPAGFAVTYSIYSGGTWVATNPNSSPVVLQPGSQLQISVTIPSGGNFNSATGTLTLFDNVTNSYVITLVKSLN